MARQPPRELADSRTAEHLEAVCELDELDLGLPARLQAGLASFAREARYSVDVQQPTRELGSVQALSLQRILAKCSRTRCRVW